MLVRKGCNRQLKVEKNGCCRCVLAFSVSSSARLRARFLCRQGRLPVILKARQK